MLRRWEWLAIPTVLAAIVRLITPVVAAATDPVGLRAVAPPRQVRIGAAVAYPQIAEDDAYAALLRREFNMVTAENAIKWDTIHPFPHRYDFRAADRIVAMARRNGMRVRGHTLAWHSQNPPWLEGALTSRRRAIAILRAHVRRVVGHFRGKVAQWDVVNEPIGPEGGFADSPWLRAIGPGYIEMAFRFARHAAPEAKLYVNEFVPDGANAKADALVALVADLRARRVPIDGVGIQSHGVCITSCATVFTQLGADLARLAELGVDVAVTELDVALPLPTTDDWLAQQADAYARAVDACASVARCREIVMWGFTDRYSWIPGFLPGFGEALPFDADYRAKPAYRALHDRLRALAEVR